MAVPAEDATVGLRSDDDGDRELPGERRLATEGDRELPGERRLAADGDRAPGGRAEWRSIVARPQGVITRQRARAQCHETLRGRQRRPRLLEMN